MKNNTTPTLSFTEVTPQERLAYAWAVAQSHAYRSHSVSERLLERCREATHQLSTPDCWMLLSEVPQLQY